MSLALFAQWVRGQRTAYLVTLDGEILPVAFADVLHTPAVRLGTIALSGTDAQNQASAARARKAARS